MAVKLKKHIMSSQARRVELSREKWREKTKSLRLELDRKNIRHLELQQSRDNWRQKSQEQAAKISQLEAELAQILGKKK